MLITATRIMPLPADTVWTLFGERFADIGDWADAIIASHLDGDLGTGAVRTCELKGFGPASGTIKEEITHFDRATRSLTYDILSGMPKFITGTQNAWTIEDLGDGTSRVTSRARFDLVWWIWPLAPLLRMQMSKGLNGFLGQLERAAGAQDQIAGTPIAV